MKRPTPYVDKTVYTGWNAMCVSAYLAAARVLEMSEPRHFALRSLDRLLSQGWNGRTADKGPALKHVIAYSDPEAEHREIDGVLDDYAFTVIACLDAYETTADLSYFRFARAVADAMVARFFDPVAGGFFDTARGDSDSSDQNVLGILGARRKPFQDSPTPAGNPAAAIALLRLHSYTAEASYREKAEQTLAIFAGGAAQYGMFAATYGLALMHLLQPHTQVVVIGHDEAAADLCRAALRTFSLGKSVLCMAASEAVRQNLAPALAETIPHLPALRDRRSFAVICSNFTCQAPMWNAEEVEQQLGAPIRIAS